MSFCVPNLIMPQSVNDFPSQLTNTTRTLVHLYVSESGWIFHIHPYQPDHGRPDKGEGRDESHSNLAWIQGCSGLVWSGLVAGKGNWQIDPGWPSNRKPEPQDDDIRDVHIFTEICLYHSSSWNRCSWRLERVPGWQSTGQGDVSTSLMLGAQAQSTLIYSVYLMLNF